MAYGGIFTGKYHVLDRVAVIYSSPKFDAPKKYPGTILSINIAQHGSFKNAYGVHLDGDFTPEGRLSLTYCSEISLERLDK